MGGATGLGNDWPAIFAHLKAERRAVRRMPDWNRCEGLNTRLGAPSPDRVTADRYLRKKTRTMDPIALMAIDATKQALADSGLLDAPCCAKGSSWPTPISTWSTSAARRSTASWASRVSSTSNT